MAETVAVEVGALVLLAVPPGVMGGVGEALREGVVEAVAERLGLGVAEGGATAKPYEKSHV